MLNLLATVATASALASGSLPAIQVARLWRNRSAEGISVVWVVGGLANSAIWATYALALGSTPLVLSNVLGLLMNVAMTTVVFAVRHPRLARGPAGFPIARVAKAVVHDPALAAEFASLVEAHEADRFSAADTLVLRPGDLSLSA
jgi:hypothetical protein